jgi:O-antigen biosynthesis protein
MMRFDDTCNICGLSEFQPFAERADGIPVVLCRCCGHGVIRYLPGAVEDLYRDAYFSSSKDASVGYDDYPYTAEHGVSWAAALGQLLFPSGRILDIGCANGHLLRKFGAAYERFGIELNQSAAEECRMNGITVLASDVLDQNLRRDHEGEFNLALAIAVFEHITDFKGAVEAAMALLRTDGLLLFEVPLLSEYDRSDPWLRTSLEHIHYPTERSLHHLFETILGLELIGSRVLIHRFGQTYVGLAAKSRKVMEAAAQCFDRCMHAPPGRLTAEEARFRCLFGLIHTADTSPEMLALCEYLTPSDLNPLAVRRLLDLWKADMLRAVGVLEHCKHVESYLKEVEAARDWHAEESRKRDEILKEVEAARDWHAEESRKRDEMLRELADDRDTQVRTIERMQTEKAEMEASWIWRISRLVRSLGLRRANATPADHRK